MSKIDELEYESLTSLEIAELTGKRHDHVLRGIDKMMKDLDIPLDTHISTYKDRKGETRRCYVLPKDLYISLLNGYKNISPNFKAKRYGYKIVRNEFSFGKDIVENLFEGHDIIPQYKVCGGKYMVDWYIKDMNIVIEFDEEYHKFRSKEDLMREREIAKELGCTIIRYKNYKK
jgi:very-short-patch-repair endonuclease